jgi:hypothetical protein
MAIVEPVVGGRIIVGKPQITYAVHNLGDPRLIQLTLDADECVFCEAAWRYCGFDDIGDTAFICLGEGELHVHMVEVVAIDERERLCLKCYPITAEDARAFIRKYAKN